MAKNHNARLLNPPVLPQTNPNAARSYGPGSTGANARNAMYAQPVNWGGTAQAPVQGYAVGAPSVSQSMRSAMPQSPLQPVTAAPRQGIPSVPAANFQQPAPPPQQQRPAGTPPPTIVAQANNPFPGHSDFPYPWETGAAASARIYKEWEARGFQPLPKQWDAQRPGGSGVQGTGAYAPPNPLNNPAASSPGGFSSGGQLVTQPGQTVGQAQAMGGQGGFGGGGGMPGEEKLEQARQRAFSLLAQQRGIFDSPQAQQLMGSLSRQLSGQDSPFSDAMAANLLSQAGDQSGAALASDQEAIRRMFARQGMSGGGGQLSAMLSARDRHNNATSRANQDIQIQQGAANFGARERAQQGMNSFLSSKAAASLPATLAETDLLSRFEVTGDAGLNALASALGQGIGSANPMGILPSMGGLATTGIPREGMTRTATGGTRPGAGGIGSFAGLATQGSSDPRSLAGRQGSLAIEQHSPEVQRAQAMAEYQRQQDAAAAAMRGQQRAAFVGPQQDWVGQNLALNGVQGGAGGGLLGALAAALGGGQRMGPGQRPVAPMTPAQALQAPLDARARGERGGAPNPYSGYENVVSFPGAYPAAAAQPGNPYASPNGGYNYPMGPPQRGPAPPVPALGPRSLWTGSVLDYLTDYNVIS